MPGWLCFPPDYSDYGFGQPLVRGVCEKKNGLLFFQQQTDTWEGKVLLEGRMG